MVTNFATDAKQKKERGERREERGERREEIIF